jgi:SAM-dependent methyltransferase
MTFNESRQSKDNPNYSGINELVMAENFLRNYSRYVVKLIYRYSDLPSKKKPRVLEFGAGTGQLALEFDKISSLKPDCVEIDPAMLKQLRSRGFACYESLNQILKPYPNLVYSSNVLEHIENDKAALLELRRILPPDGMLILYVPALPFLFGDMDKRIGHFRRYTRRELRRKLDETQFEIKHIQYVDSLGVLASLITKWFGYKNYRFYRLHLDLYRIQN